MRQIFGGLLAAVLSVSAAGAWQVRPAVETPHIEDFLADIEVSRPRLSPDGTRIAYHDRGEPLAPGNRLFVRDLDAPRGQGYVQANFGEFSILAVSWANDERLLVTLGMLGNVDLRYNSLRATFTVPFQRVISLSHEVLNDPVVLFEGEGRSVERNIANINLGEIADLLPGQNDHILMPAYRGSALHLWRVNILTGEADIVERGNPRTARWYTGPDGRAVMRVDVSSRGRRISVFTRSGDSSRWRRSATYRTNELSDSAPEFDWAGASADPGQIYVFARPEDGDRTGVYLYDVNAGEYVDTVGSHDRVDVTGTMIHPRTGRYMGYSYIEDRLQIEFEDEELARHYRGIDNFFGGEVSVMPRDYAQGRMIVEVSGPQEPGVYYLYDEQAASIEPLYPSRPRLPPDVLARVDIINYTARDGLALTGYLTVPRGGATPTTPLVVMPHGGPEMRDVYDFDLFAQYLAANGYAVFQPNFRGSSGYGESFADAGRRQWGAAMQNDITDGVEYLITNGRAARDRICIAGFSYGGYAALMGGATTPDLYQCVIAGAPVTDLAEFVDHWREAEEEEALDYWRETIGDPRSERDRLAATSPVNLADRFVAPVLLLHGDRDAIVPVSHGRDMAAALEQAGVVHHYEEYRGGGHDFSSDAELRSVMVRSADLLSRTIGDLRGSAEVFPAELDGLTGDKPEADDADDSDASDEGDDSDG